MAKRRIAKKETTCRNSKVRAREIRRVDERLEIECLEGRHMLSTILWTNRADFDIELAPNTDAARTIIDQALLDWGAAIDSFNYRNVGEDGWSPSTSYTLTIGVKDWQAEPDNTNTLARCGPDEIDGDGKPFSGTMWIDDNAANGLWAFDDTPWNDYEFPNPVAPFASLGGPAGTDLYSTVLHELGHGLGLASNEELAIRDRISNHVFTFADGSQTVLTTDDVHIADRNTGTVNPVDLMNPELGGGERRTMSDLDARLLGEAYGYSINLNSVFARTFVTTYDPAVRKLTVHGDLTTTFNNIETADQIYLNVMQDDIFVAVNGYGKTKSTLSVDSIEVLGKASVDQINIEATRNGIPVTIRGGAGQNSVYLSSGLKNLLHIQGDVTIIEEGGTTNVNLQDGKNPSGRIFTVNPNVVSFAGSPANITYGSYADPTQNVDRLTIRGGSGANAASGGNTFNVQNQFAPDTFVKIFAGIGNDVVTVDSVGLRGVNIDGVNGVDRVTVGTAADNMGDILGSVWVSNTYGFTNLIYEDSSDFGLRNHVQMDAGRIRGLCGKTMYYTPAGIKSVTVHTGRDATLKGNLITVHDTPQNRAGDLAVTINTGKLADKTLVYGTHSALTIEGQNGVDTVIVGDGSLQGKILGRVSVNNKSSLSKLQIDDSRDPTWQSFWMSDKAVELAGAKINFKENDLLSLDVFTGPAGSYCEVYDTPQNVAGTTTTSMDLGAGVDETKIFKTTGPLNLQGDGGRDIVTVGTGKLDQIQGVIDIRNTPAGGFTDLKIDGSRDTISRTFTVDESNVQWLTNGQTTPVEIRFKQADLHALTVSAGRVGNPFHVLNTPQNGPANLAVTLNTGTGTDVVNVQRIRSQTSINGQNGADVVNIGQDGRINGIGKSLFISNLSSYSTINVDNSADAQGHAVTMSVVPTPLGTYGIIEGLTGVAEGQIQYWQSDLRALNVWGGTGIDIFTVHNTANSNIPGGSPTTIHAGQGADTIRVTGTTGALIVHPEGSNNLVNLGGDGAGSGSLTPLRGNVSVVGEGGDGNYLEINDRASTGRYVYSMDGARVVRTPLTGTAPAVNLDVSEYSIVGMNFVGANKGNRYEIVGTKTTSLSYPGGGFQMYAGDLNDVVNVTGASPGLWNVNMGGGSNQSIIFGDATHSLDSILSEVVVTGTGFINATVSDAASTTHHFGRFDYQGGRQILDRRALGSEALLLNRFQFQFGGSGRVNYNAGAVTEAARYNQIDVLGIGANTEIVVNGGPDMELVTSLFGTNFGTNAGPLTFNGSVQDLDQAYYLDNFKGSSSQYSLRTNPLDPTGLVVVNAGAPTVLFNGMTSLIHYTPEAGGNTMDIQSLPDIDMITVVAGGDSVTVGNTIPGYGRSMSSINGSMKFVKYRPSNGNVVNFSLDDSANNVASRNVAISRYTDLNGDWGQIDGFGPNSIVFVDRAEFNFSLSGGEMNDSFVMSGNPLAARFTIDGGSGNDILVGSGGNSLFGGAGMDLLIAGSLTSHLDGGLGEDILVGGSLNDTSTSNVNAIRDLWTNTGLGYGTRVSILLDTLLTSDRVTGNGNSDTLTGGLDSLDFFYGELETDLSSGDLVTDLQDGEQFMPLS